jgi:hypothetical protein
LPKKSGNVSFQKRLIDALIGLTYGVVVPFQLKITIRYEVNTGDAKSRMVIGEWKLMMLFVILFMMTLIRNNASPDNGEMKDRLYLLCVY